MNKDRLKKLIYDLEMEEKDLEDSLELMNLYVNNELLKKQISNSLKYKYLRLFVLYEDIIAMLLKEYNCYKIGITVDLAIKLLKDKNIINEELSIYLNIARLLRNRIGHRYKQPKVEVLIEFLQENKDIRKELLIFIKSFS